MAIAVSQNNYCRLDSISTPYTFIMWFDFTTIKTGSGISGQNSLICLGNVATIGNAIDIKAVWDNSNTTFISVYDGNNDLYIYQTPTIGNPFWVAFSFDNTNCNAYYQTINGSMGILNFTNNTGRPVFSVPNVDFSQPQSIYFGASSYDTSLQYSIGNILNIKYFNSVLSTNQILNEALSFLPKNNGCAGWYPASSGSLSNDLIDYSGNARVLNQVGSLSYSNDSILLTQPPILAYKKLIYNASPLMLLAP